MNYRPLAAGLALSALLLPLPVAANSAPVDDERDEIHAKLAQLVDQMLEDVKNDVTYECTCSDEGSEGGHCPTKDAPSAKLAGMFAYGDTVIEVFEPIAVEVVEADSTSEEQSDALIGMLLETRNPAVAPIAEAMHEVAPKRFASHKLLAFCEMGSKPLMEPLAARVKKGKAGVPSAAFLAMKGDKTGRKVLKKASAAKEITTENALDVLLAGYALENLGEKGALYKAQIKVHDATIAALDTDEIETARTLAITAMIAEKATRTTKPGFSLMQLRCSEAMAECEAHGKLATADAIFDLIQEATPIG